MNRNIILWILTLFAIAAFWISIRTPEHQVEYTLAALGIWGVVWLLNRRFKKEKDSEDQS